MRRAYEADDVKPPYSINHVINTKIVINHNDFCKFDDLHVSPLRNTSFTGSFTTYFFTKTSSTFRISIHDSEKNYNVHHRDIETLLSWTHLLKCKSRFYINPAWPSWNCNTDLWAVVNNAGFRSSMASVQKSYRPGSGKGNVSTSKGQLVWITPLKSIMVLSWERSQFHAMLSFYTIEETTMKWIKRM